MLPKRGRGRGRGAPPNWQEQDPPAQQPGRDLPRGDSGHHVPLQQQRAPPRFFTPSPRPVEAVESRPTVAAATNPQKRKIKTRTVDPEELGFELKQKLAISPTFPARPGFGTLGRKIKLISNYFPIKVPSGYVYQYDVEIETVKQNKDAEEKDTSELPPGAKKHHKKYRCLSTKRNREIIRLMLENDKHFCGLLAAYDGQKTLYTRKELKAQFPVKCQVILADENPGRPDDPRGPKQDVFEVRIKPVLKEDTISCAINLDSLHAFYEKRSSSVPQETIMALETILRHGPCLRFTPIGRSFFYPPSPEDIHPLGGGREIWFGYHQSLRLGQWKPMVNLDITATTFYQEGPVLNYIAKFMKTTVEELHRSVRFTDGDIRKISKELKNMRIEVNHLRGYKRKYRIIKLTRDSANRLEFDLMVNGETVKKTVATYFKDTYDLVLKFPNLPCLQVNPEAKNIYLPIEVCEIIAGQHCKKKLEERQLADMIKFTARAPYDRFREIKQIVNDRADFAHDESVRGFGFEVSREPLSLDGRVLDAPNVMYKDQHIRPRDGSWNMQQTQFFRGAEILSWVLISFAVPKFCSTHNLDRFADMLRKIGKECGIAINPPSLITTEDTDRVNIKNLLNDMKREYRADLAVIVVPSKNKTLYGEIKQAAETGIGLITQCVKDENVVKKCNPALVSNLCQKINAKMGGINNLLVPSETPDIFNNPVIIIGADVTHQARTNEVRPSLAACVGSLDCNPSRYAVTVEAQPNMDNNMKSIEIIGNLKRMIIYLLKAFYQNTKGKKPEKIIFYRDGVSEGEFDKVLNDEVKSIREACQTLDKDYTPGITYIVVQKRHHTRFMPQDHRNGVGRMKNVPPGTIVDTTVTHPLNFDFFLCSHVGLQGTSRPAHYTVIADDNNFSANELHKLTYYLAYLSVRCTKSISIPVPVLYAHLAAYRARQHLDAKIEDSDGSSSGGSYSSLRPEVFDAIKVLNEMKSSMYFV